MSCRPVAPGELDAGMPARCAELGFGEPTTKTFKIPYEATCRTGAGALTIRWVYPAGVRLERRLARPCSTVEPRWVQGDTALLRPILGAVVPVAAAWIRDGSGATERRELEWAQADLDGARIEERLSEIQYSVVNEDANGKHLSRRRPCDFSFFFATGGPEPDRLITSKRSPVGAPPCPPWP